VESSPRLRLTSTDVIAFRDGRIAAGAANLTLFLAVAHFEAFLAAEMAIERFCSSCPSGVVMVAGVTVSSDAG